MPDKIPLIQPGDCVLLLVDLQAGLAFGVSSEDRQTLINNAIALARTAVVFGLVCWSSGSTSGRFGRTGDPSGPQCFMTGTAMAGGK
jgi:hypothetical protein